MKIRKSVYTICLVVLLLLSSMLLFACNKNETSANTYKAFNSIMTQINEDEELFEEQDIDFGNAKTMKANYYLNDFYPKDSEDAQLVDYEYYILLLDIGLNHINAYYPLLENLKLKTDYSKLKEDVSDLKKSYNEVKAEHKKIKTDATDVNFIIYNGYFSRYRTAVKNFVNKTYDAALSLYNFFYNEAEFDKNLVKESASENIVSFYSNYNIFKVYDDYRLFFMTSCKGELVDNGLFTTAKTDLNSWVADMTNKSIKTLSQEEVEELKNICDRVNADRSLARKAISKFSVYKFERDYSGSLSAYNKSNSNASVYCERIEDYLTDSTSNTLSNFKSYIINNIVTDTIVL